MDEKLENIDNLDSEINPDKEQVVFDKKVFAEFDKDLGAMESIGENEELFIENDGDVIEGISEIKL